ncbi:MAG: O-antigen ligase family protein [Planctomycetota bacterium]
MTDSTSDSAPQPQAPSQPIAPSPQAAAEATLLQALPSYGVYTLLAAVLFIMALMFTGGAEAPWAYGFGGMIELGILCVPLCLGLARVERVARAGVTWVPVLGGLFLAWAAVHLIPLTPAWFEALSPHGAELLQKYGGWDGTSAHPLALVPSLTRETIVIWVIGFAVLLTTVLVVRGRHLPLFAKVIALGTGVWSIYGLGVFALLHGWPYKLFGVPNLAARVSGPLVNSNRFAFLLELGLPFCLMQMRLAMRGIDLSRRRIRWRVKIHSLLTDRPVMLRVALWGINLIMVAVALILSRSRGGLIATLVAVLAGYLLLRMVEGRQSISRRIFTRGTLLLAVLTLLALVLALATGENPVVERFQTIFADKVSRWDVWSAIFPMARDFLGTGTGPGTFRGVFPAYQPGALAGYYKFAHNDYLNLVTDVGLPGLGLVLLFVALWVRCAWQRFRTGAAEAIPWYWAALVGVLAVAIHSIVDFGLQDPTVLWYCLFIVGLGVCPPGNPLQRHSSRSSASKSSKSEAAQTASAAAALLAAAEVAAAVPSRRSSAAARRWWRMVGGTTFVGAVVALIAVSPYALADFVRPGNLWVHIEYTTGSPDLTWERGDLADWEADWRDALPIAPRSSLANFEIASAMYYQLRLDIADQPLVAPSRETIDHTFRLTRYQTDLDWTPDQRDRIAAGRALVATALAQRPFNAEFHLLKLRYAVFAGDRAAVRAELPVCQSLWQFSPRALLELNRDLTWLYQSGPDTMTTAAFRAQQEDLTRSGMAVAAAGDLSATEGFALNYGVPLKQLAEWLPDGADPLRNLANFLESVRWYDAAQVYFAKSAELPTDDLAGSLASHSDWMHYLELCLQQDELRPFTQELKLLLPQLSPFEQRELYHDRLCSHLPANPITLGNLLPIIVATPPASDPSAAAARLELIGDIALQLSDTQGAEKSFKAAIGIDPNVPSVMHQLAALEAQDGDYMAAAHQIENCMTYEPENQIPLMRQLAYYYTQAGELEEAISTYRTLMTVDPDHRQEYAARAGALAAAKQ